MRRATQRVAPTMFYIQFRKVMSLAPLQLGSLCALCASVVKVPVVKSHTKKGAPPMTDTPDWRENGVRIVRSGELDSNTHNRPA